MKEIHNQSTMCPGKFFEELKHGRVNNIDALLSDEVEIHIVGREGVVPFAGTYKGKDGVLGYLNSFIESLRPFFPQGQP